MAKVKITDAQRNDIIQILKALKDIVRPDKEDFVYRSSEVFTDCLYVRDSDADCLAGRVLFVLGVSIPALVRLEGHGVVEFANFPECRLTVPALRVLEKAQATQDIADRTWGDARDAALFFAYATYGVIVP